MVRVGPECPLLSPVHDVLASRIADSRREWAWKEKASIDVALSGVALLLTCRIT